MQYVNLGDLYQWLFKWSEYTKALYKQLHYLYWPGCFDQIWLLGNYRKLENGLVLNQKFYSGKKSKLK